MPAQVRAALGEHRRQRVAIERHQHGRVRAAGGVHGRGLFRGKEVLAHRLIIETWRERS